MGVQLVFEMVDDWSAGPGPEILDFLGEIYASLADGVAA